MKKLKEKNTMIIVNCNKDIEAVRKAYELGRKFGRKEERNRIIKRNIKI